MSEKETGVGCFGCLATLIVTAMFLVVLGLIVKAFVIAFMAGWGAL